VYEYHENFRKVVTFFTYRALTLLNADGEWEVDEALVTSKKRDRRGRDARFNIWAFGLHSRLLNLSIVYLVPNRRKVTLYPLIQHFIQPGSTIYSDQFKTYVNTNTNSKRSLIEEFFPNNNYCHLWVNHKHTFLNRYNAKINTNSIENDWKNLISLTRRKLTVRTIKYFIGEFNFRQLIKFEQEQFDILLYMLSKYNLVDRNFF